MNEKVYVPRPIIFVFVLIVIIFLSIILVNLYFSKKHKIPIASEVNITKNQESSLPSLPIDLKSSAVKKVRIMYLMSGVITNLNPVTNSNKKAVEIQISSPTGQSMNKKFTVFEDAIIVKLDKTGIEKTTKLSELKVSTPIQIDYYVNLLNQSEEYVSKIALLE